MPRPSIALIGPDGAGKTTLCRMLLDSRLLPFRYVYMGINYSASNVALPTTRLVHWWRKRNGWKEDTGPAARAYRPVGGVKKWLRLAAAFPGLLNRLAEEWYRQMVSWTYRLRGYVVLYDRHFVFDFALPDARQDSEPPHRKLHRWLLRRFYPRPDLVILLDAPAEVLYARKGEFSVAILENRRRNLLLEARRCPSFVRVNVARPLERVYSDVAGAVWDFCMKRGADASRVDLPPRG